LAESIILSDFDGTISLDDVNDKLFSLYGDEVSEQIDKDYYNGEISDKEALLKQYQRIRLSKEEFFNFIDTTIKVDKYFYSFYKKLKDKRIAFAIVSGGFSNYIEYLIEREGVPFNDKIYANTLYFDKKRLIPILNHDISSCHQSFGVCGNCKHRIVIELKKEYEKIIYIGDGLTDRCVVNEVDYIFAKTGRPLESFCDNEGLSYIPYESFNDLNIKIFALLSVLKNVCI